MMACPSITFPPSSRPTRKGRSQSLSFMAEEKIFVGKKRKASLELDSPAPKKRAIPPEEQAHLLATEAHTKSHPSLLQRLIGTKPEPYSAAILYVTAAKKYKNLLQYEKAADCYMDAAECYELCNDLESMKAAAACHKSAAKRLMELVARPLMEPLPHEFREDLLLEAVDEWDFALQIYRRGEDYKRAQMAALEKANCFLLLRDWVAAGAVYIKATTLGQQQLHELNRFLVFSAACYILKNDPVKALDRFEQIKRNFGRQTTNRKYSLPADTSRIQCLCGLYLDLDKKKPDQYPGDLPNFERAEVRPHQQFQELLREYVDTRKPHTKLRLQSETNTILENLLLTHVLRRLTTFPGHPDKGPIDLYTTAGHRVRLWIDEHGSK